MQFNITIIMAVATILTGAAATLTSLEGNSTSCYGACETDLKAVLFGSSFQGGEDSTFFDAVACITKCGREKFSLYPKQSPDYSKKRGAGFQTLGLFEIDLLEKLFPKSKESTGVFPYPSARPHRVLKILSELHPYLSTLQATPPDKVVTSCYSVCEPVIEAFMFMDKHGADYHQELFYDTAKFCITHCEEKGSQWIEDSVAAAKKSLAEMKEADSEKLIAGYKDDTSHLIADFILRWHSTVNSLEEADLKKQVAETHAANIKSHGPQHTRTEHNCATCFAEVTQKWEPTTTETVGRAEPTDSEQQITETKEAKIEKHGPQYRNEGDEGDVPGHLTDSSRCGMWL
ncbi:hypothetical protein LTR10_005583 [Elasticomyces elasticus]|nr:hypothetical protein LTR10_005583 [Elasticomyces elasticus]KAK4976320.1 hypothetical protein LTR42_003949 [Elasticomyces elasticus]